MQKWKRWLGIGILGAAIITALVFALRSPPVPVDMGRVTKGELIVTIDDEGETRVREKYVVSAPLGGRLLRITQDAGDPVEAGETVLARIQPSEPTFLDVRSQSEAQARLKAAQASLDLAFADLEKMKAERDFAQSELRRIEELAKSQTVSEASADRARMQFSAARAAVASAQAAVDVAEHQVESARASLISPQGNIQGSVDARCCVVDVRSPITGRVLRLLEESEAIVTAGTPLVEVGNPNDLEIVVDLLSSDAVKVQPGASAFITDWGGDYDLPAVVRRVEPFGFTKISALGVEEQRVNVILDFAEPNTMPDSLGHGFRVEARIEEWRAEDVVQIPEAALFRRGNRWAAFIVEDGRAREVSLEVGRSNGRQAQVLSGVTPGDTVVLYPGEKVQTGARLTQRSL